MSMWATYIVDHGASLHYPPRIVEFDDIILEPLYKKNPKHAIHGSTVAELLAPQIGGIPVGGVTRELHFLHGGHLGPWPHHGSRKRHSDPDSPLSSPVKRRQKAYDVSSSPLSTEISLCVDSLQTFQDWCHAKYPNYNWSELFDILRSADVGLDSFSRGKTTKASKLMRLCSNGNKPLKEATAERLCKVHARWVKKGKPSI